MTFVAGTLVHTKESLKPIEQIKVGDWVLSKPEDGTGETTYKRVTETFEFEDKELWYFDVSDGVQQTLHPFVVTPNHPFWVVDIGWVRADHLSTGSKLLLEDGRIVEVIFWGPAAKTNQADIFVSMGFMMQDWNSFSGTLVNFNNISYAYRGELGKDCWQQVDHESYQCRDYYIEEENKVRAKVYNFTIEDYHTYFLGEWGVFSFCGVV